MNLFSRVKNLYNIERVYSDYRDLVEHPELRSDVKTWLKLFNDLLSVQEVQEMLAGYKTYLMAGGVVAVTLLHFFGVIDNQTYTNLMALFGAGGLTALRAGVSKLQ